MSQPPLTTSASDGSRGSSASRSARARRRVGALAGAKLGRARARIGRDLGFVRRDGTLGEQAEGRRRRLDIGQMPRHAGGAASLGEERLDDAVLERMEGHHHEPPGRLRGFARRRQAPCASSASSSLTKMRSAWNVRVAGWIWFGLARTTRPTMSASARVVRIGASLRAATMARATRARMPLLAELEDDVGEIALRGLRHHVGGARAVAAHAHVERAVEPEREAALGLIELHRGHAEIEHDAVDRGVAEFFRDAIELGEARLDQRQSASGRLDQTRRRSPRRSGRGRCR